MGCARKMVSRKEGRWRRMRTYFDLVEVDALLHVLFKEMRQEGYDQ